MTKRKWKKILRNAYIEAIYAEHIADNEKDKDMWKTVGAIFHTLNKSINE